METLGISTDVDRLVLALRAAPGRNFSMAELAAASGMAERAVRKWVRALEAEGKVAVRYSLTKELVRWIAPVEAEEPVGKEEEAGIAHRQVRISRVEAEEPAGKEEAGAANIEARHEVPASGIAGVATANMEAQDEVSGAGIADSAGDIKTARELEEGARRRREYEKLMAEKRMLLSQLIMLEAENEKMRQRKEQRQMEESEEEITRIVESVRRMEDASERQIEEAMEGKNERADEDSEPMTADGARIVPVEGEEFAGAQSEGKAAASPGKPMEGGGDSGESGDGDNPETEEVEIIPSNEEAAIKGKEEMEIIPNNEEGAAIKGKEIEIIPNNEEGAAIKGKEIEIIPSPQPQAAEGERVRKGLGRPEARVQRAKFFPDISARKKLQKDGRLDEFSGRLASHMARIQAKAREIEKIKAEKRRLLHEVYAPLSAKAQEELEVISDRILDYENRLLALREHVAGLPGQVADASERHEKMASLAKEMQRLYDETEAMSEESLRALLEAKENAQIKADEVRTLQFEQENMLSSLRSELSRVSALQSDAEGRLSDAEGALERQREGVENAREQLGKIAEAKAQTEGEMEGINSEIGRQRQVLADLDLHLERMDTVAGFVRENRRDYQGKMNALAEYVAKGENEYAAIRESVEANFVRKYLRELRAVSESYEFELSQAKGAEAHYDKEIERAKLELERMIEEAKRISQMQEMQLDESAHGPAEGKEERLLAAVSSSLRQRERLRSYIREAISGERKAKPRQADAKKIGKRGRKSKR